MVVDGRRRLVDLVSPRVAFLDTHEPARPLWWIIGTQRSGTTWVGELIDPEQRHRVLFEPFHPVHSRVAQQAGLRWGEFVPPGSPHAALVRAVDRMARGRVRDPWIDRQNRRRIYRSRMVKDVSATNLVPWLAHHRPDDRVVLVLRHPFAVAWSLAEVPWASGRDDTDALFDQPVLHDAIGPVPGLDEWMTRAGEDSFLRRILKWCMENALPLRSAAEGRYDVVHYEDLVVDPAAGMEALDVAAPPDPTRPSRTDFRGRARDLRDRPEELVTGWRDSLQPHEIDTGLAVLDAFGLAQYYGESPWPHRAQG
jgi:hypothetical protein